MKWTFIILVSRSFFVFFHLILEKALSSWYKSCMQTISNNMKLVHILVIIIKITGLNLHL